MGPSGDQVGSNGDQVETKWDHVGTKWGPSGDQVGTKWFFGSEVSAFNGKTPARIKILRFFESGKNQKAAANRSV